MKIWQRVKQLQTEISNLNESCTHELLVETSHDKDGVWCEECHRGFGWWCPESPDHACHYHTHHGMVELANGDLIEPPDTWEGPESENYDMCIYCGDPDERK